MIRIGIVTLAIITVVFSSSCYRHPAKESKYFFTQQLPKKEKKKMKAYFAERLGTATTSKKEKGTGSKKIELFPANEL